jgi:hypothetical protein
MSFTLPDEWKRALIAGFFYGTAGICVVPALALPLAPLLCPDHYRGVAIEAVVSQSDDGSTGYGCPRLYCVTSDGDILCVARIVTAIVAATVAFAVALVVLYLLAIAKKLPGIDE